MERIIIMSEKLVQKRAKLYDSGGHPVIIEAGPEHWTVIFENGSKISQESNWGTSSNFNEAVRAAEDKLMPPLTPRGGDYYP